MAQNKDFRIQTTGQPTPAAGISTFYADASGQLKFVNSNGSHYTQGHLFTGTLSLLGGTPVSGGTGAPVIQPVTVYGSTGFRLGGADAYLAVIDGSGRKLAIPAYLWT